MRVCHKSEIPDGALTEQDGLAKNCSIFINKTLCFEKLEILRCYICEKSWLQKWMKLIKYKDKVFKNWNKLFFTTFAA